MNRISKSEVETRPVRVLRIITRMNIGGPAVQIETLMKFLPDKQFEQLLILGKCETDEQELSSWDIPFLKYSRISKLGRSVKPIRDLYVLVSLCRQILDFQPDVIHTHTFKAGVLGRVAALLVKSHAKIVHTYHGHLLYGYFRFLKLHLLISIEKFLAVNSDALVTVGNKVAEELLAKGIGVRAQYHVIPPGFEMEANTNVANKVSEMKKSSEFVCVWVGRFVHIKRPDRMLEIVSELTRRNLRIQFKMVGDGPLKNEIEIESNARNLPITFTGWSHAVKEILRNSHLLILTSENEGTPLSIIEAQKLGIPVLATDVGSVSEVLVNGETGYAMPFDSRLFANRTQELLQNFDMYNRFAKAAVSNSNENFSSKRLVIDHVRLYTQLVGR